MSKHTLGPWTDDQADHDAPYQNIKIMGGSPRRTVCTVWIDDAPVHDFNAEQDANARLIAAAPDLLEFARMVVNGEGNSIRSIFEVGRAAIAKAEGEAP